VHQDLQGTLEKQQLAISHFSKRFQGNLETGEMILAVFKSFWQIQKFWCLRDYSFNTIKKGEF
jgi:hypothetical protein